MADRNKPPCFICPGGLIRVAALENGREVHRCPTCGLRRLWPLPSADELRHFYEREDYFRSDLEELHRGLIKGYDPRAPIIRLYERQLRQIAGVQPPPADLFEIGCARGVFLDLARRRGYRVAGLEMNPAAAGYAREQFGLAVTAGPIEEVPKLPPQDVVVAFDVLEHVLDPEAFIGAVSGLLKPGGLLVIGTPDADSFLYRLAELLARCGGRRSTYPLFRFFGRGQEHLQIFSRGCLAGLLERRGFTVIRRVPYGIPVGNMCSLTVGYSLVLRLLGTGSYESAYLARKAT